MKVITSSILVLLLVGLLVWPGWAWGHPIWEKPQQVTPAEQAKGEEPCKGEFAVEGLTFSYEVPPGNEKVYGDLTQVIVRCEEGKTSFELLNSQEPSASLVPTTTPTPKANQQAVPTWQTATPVVPTPAASAVQNMECRAIHDYQLKGLTEVATSEGGWIHVEYWTGGNAPEFETLLPGGRYIIITNFAGGHVWEYPATCSFEQVMSQIQAHISRRPAQKANNGGYVHWEQTGYFQRIR